MRTARPLTPPHTCPPHPSCHRILQKVESGTYSFACKGWDQVTEAAKDMINHMLVKDEEKRWRAEQLLEHPWFQVALTSPAAALGLHMVKRLQVFAGMNRCAAQPLHAPPCQPVQPWLLLLLLCWVVCAGVLQCSGVGAQRVWCGSGCVMAWLLSGGMPGSAEEPQTAAAACTAGLG